MIEALFGWPPPVLDPMGPYAASVRTVAWALTGLSTAITLLVLAALYTAFRGPERWRKRLGGERSVVVLGIALPAVVLAALLVWGLSLTSRLERPVAADAMRVRLTGEMWWFRVQYLGAQGQIAMEDANELHIPTGRPVVAELVSADVIHNFWVPHLSGKRDMIPGRINTLTIQADKPGVYGAVCAEYCGRAHALMGMVVVAHDSAGWERWLAARRLPLAAASAQPQGEQLFIAAGCAACHRVAGTPAQGRAGPDLSHVGSRLRLGAGILPNHKGTMIGWIGNSQSIKPGNRMPNYDRLGARELELLADWLGTRK